MDQILIQMMGMGVTPPASEAAATQEAPAAASKRQRFRRVTTVELAEVRRQ